MNFKKVIIFFLLFSLLSYYYFHHELEKRSQETEIKSKEKKILLLDDADFIHYLSLEYEGVDIEMEREEGDEWYIKEPVTDNADGFVVNGIISTLQIDKKVRDLTDTQFDYTTIGLQPPKIRIGIGYGDVRRYLLLGDETYVGSDYYARWEDTEEVFLVSENFFKLFKKDLYSLRQKTLFTYDFNAVNEFTITLRGSAVRIEKIATERGEEWWIAEPYENRANFELAEEFLHNLRGVMVSKFHDDMEIDDKVTGLKKKENMFTVKFDESQETLYFGSKSEDEKTYYAYLESKGVVISLAADKIDSLKKDYDYFLDTRIYSFDVNNVGKFVFRKDERLVTYEKKNRVWQNVEAPPDVQAEREQEGMDEGEDISMIVDEIVNFCSELKYDMILAPEVNEANEQVPVVEPENLICSLGFFINGRDEEINLNLFAKDNLYIVKEDKDPNYFTITPEDYDMLNQMLKLIL